MPRKPSPRSRPRIEEVARVAGVAPMTVSRAINTPELVAVETLQRVREAIKTTGYVPDRAARSLRSQRSKIIGIINPRVRTSVLHDFVDGMTTTLAPLGYQLLLGASGFSAQREEELISALISRKVDGIVLPATEHSPKTRELLKSAGVPIVEIFDCVPAPLDMTVGVPALKAGAEVAKYLLRQGYKHPAIICPSPNVDQRSERREQGFIKGLRESDIKLSPAQRQEAEMSIRGGSQALEALLKRVPATDAVFCTNDMLAVGALLSAQRASIAVPGRVALVGFGDIDIAAELSPPLTTVRVPGFKMGQATGELLLNVLNSGDVPSKRIELPVEIIARGSA